MKALNSPCSAGTGVDENSPSRGRSFLSPTSDDLTDHIVNEYGHDVEAELQNMRTARRRVRKGEFGRKVEEYFEARQNWETDGDLLYPNDVDHLKELSNALQQQKDLAQVLAQGNPLNYPRLRYVNEPSCSTQVYTPKHPSRRTQDWHIQ
ncbi:hypothetical protein F5B20DRAFT_557716 [Whalleya microplaca]|nr:hypothetical protein F5B20DRAFT_557716 [Whalleya microplaca]